MTIPAIWKSGLRVTSVLVLVLLFLATLALIAMATGGADFQSPQATAEVSNSSLNWGAKQVGADLMWDSDYTGQGVKIGIVDSGIDYTHPAFTNTLISTMDINLGLRDGQGITLDNWSGYTD